MPTLADRLAGLTAWLSTLPDWQAFALVVGASLCLAVIVHVGGDFLIKRYLGRFPGDLQGAVLGKVHVAVWSSLGLVGLYLGTGQLDVRPGFVDAIHATTLTAVTLVWAYTLVRTVPVVLEELAPSSYVDQQVVPIVQNVWTAIIGGVALFFVLSYWGVNVTPLLASAGVLGIVVGLAARDAIANFFGSIALYADGTYTIGDYVILESGERGRVEDISIRSTVIRTREDILVTVPNAKLNSAAIVNESAPNRHRRITVSVGVAYGSDLDRVEEILLSVAEDSEAVRERPQPRVLMRSFGDSALDLDLLCWIDDPRLRERTQDELNRAIYAAFREAGVEIPFPQREVNVSTPDGVPQPVDPDGEGHTLGGPAGPEDGE